MGNTYNNPMPYLSYTQFNIFRCVEESGTQIQQGEEE